MTAETTVEETIANARELSQDSAALAQSFSEAAQLTAGGALSVDLPKPTDPDVPTPVQAEKPIDLGPIFEAEYDQHVADVEAELNNQLRAYIDEYFPCFDNITSEICTWLQDVVQNSTTGITEAYENAVWARSRDRESLEGNRLKQEAVTDLSARGFTMPNSMLLAKLDKVNDAVFTASVTSAREQAIKHLEFAIKNVQFAIQQGIAMRAQVEQAAVKMIEAYLRAIVTGIDKAKALVDAKNSLYQYAYKYYDTYIAWGNMMMNYENILSNTNIQEARMFVDGTTRNRQSRVQAAVGGAEAMGKVAAAALASQNSMATIVHQTVQNT